MSYRITLIPGNGIGPEVAFAAQACLNATGVPVEWDVQAAGEEAIGQFGTPLPQAVLQSIRQNKVALKGPITTPIGTGISSVNVALRQSLDLFASVRPCRLYPQVHTRYKHVDLVLIRENTEDLYAGIEYGEGTPEVQELITWVKQHGGNTIRSDSAIALKAISARCSERIVRFAFEYAIRHRRKKVTAVHKANIMKHTDGLFLNVFRRIAREYAGRIDFEEQLVDSLCMQLVMSPEVYDVLVLPNLYGDIISDLCAGLVGGLGVTPGANFGKEIAVFEPVHGSAPSLAGQNKANPVATILSAVLLLRHLGETKAADRLEWAVCEVLREGRYVTSDLVALERNRHAVGTSEMTEAIVKKIKSEEKSMPVILNKKGNRRWGAGE